MTDWPSNPPLPLFVHTWSRWGPVWDKASHLDTGGNPASITCPVAGFCAYIPMFLPWPYPVARVFWICGSSTTSTNMAFGVYAADGTLIYSTGSVAAGTASTVTYTSPTEFLLSPDRYYFGIACDSSTTNRGGYGITGGTAATGALCGLLQESTFPLPATMTPATWTNPWFPVCGITRTAS